MGQDEAARVRLWSACGKLGIDGPHPRDLDGLPVKDIAAMARELERVEERVRAGIDPPLEKATWKLARRRAAMISRVLAGRATVDGLEEAEGAPVDFVVAARLDRVAALEARGVRLGLATLDYGPMARRRERRARLIEIITNRPGISLQELLGLSGLSGGSLKQLVEDLAEIEKGGHRLRREGAAGQSPRLYLDWEVVLPEPVSEPVSESVPTAAA